MQISLTIIYLYIQMQNISKELKAHFRLWNSFSQHILWTGAMMLLIPNVLSVKWQCWSGVLLKTEKNEKEICSPLPSWGTSSKKKDFISLFSERVEGREKERERNIDAWETHQSIASCTSPTMGLAHNPSMCPD